MSLRHGGEFGEGWGLLNLNSMQVWFGLSAAGQVHAH